MSEDTRIHELQRDGVTLLREVIDPSICGRVRDALTHLRDGGRPRSRQVLYTHREVPEDRPHLDNLIDQWLSPHRLEGLGSTRELAEELRPLARSLLGEEPVLFQDLLLVKRPGQRSFPWHQDFPYWPVDRPEGVVIWVPLAGCDAESGALRFARESHRLGELPVVDLHEGTPQDPAASLDFDDAEFQIFAPAYAIGDAVAFSPLVFHASPPMSRATERAVWVSIWLSPRCRWSHTHAPNHPLCRRVDDGAPVREL